MGAIKDVIDLTTQLANSVQDRKVAEELNKIQTLILGIQSEHSGLHEKNIELREDSLSLKERIQILEGENKALSSASSYAQSDDPPCPNCSTDNKPFYMSTCGRQEGRVIGATHQCSKCTYKMKKRNQS